MDPNDITVSEMSAIKQSYDTGSQFVNSDRYSVWQDRRKFDLFPKLDGRIHSLHRRLTSSYIQWAYSKTLTTVMLLLMLTL